MLNFKFNQSFTLVEVLVSMAIIAIGGIGAFITIQKGITQSAASSSRTVAAYLAQEGIEIVRNIRDTNYLNQRYDIQVSWDSGIPAGTCLEADYTSPSLSFCSGGTPKYLKRDSQGFYNYTSGKDTQFKRQIGITKLNNDNELSITVTVTWEEKNENQQFILKGNLYNTQKSLKPL